MSAAGLCPEQIRVLLKAETSCGLPSVFYIHISVSHKSLIQVLNPISFILTRLWPNLCGSLVQCPPCLFWSKAIEYDLLQYILRVLMYNQFCAGLVKWSRVRAGRIEVTVCCFIAHTAQKLLLVTQDKAS